MLNGFQKFIYNFSIVFPWNMLTYLGILFCEWLITEQITSERIIKLLIVFLFIILIELILVCFLFNFIKKLPQISIIITNKKNIERNKIIVLSNIIIPCIIRLCNQSNNISNTIGLILLIVILIVIAVLYSIGDENIPNGLIFSYHFYCVSIEINENKTSDVILLSKKEIRDFTKIKYVRRIFENMFIAEEGVE